MLVKPTPVPVQRALKAADTPPAAGQRRQARRFKVVYHYRSGPNRMSIASRITLADSEEGIARTFDQLWEADGLLQFRLTTRDSEYDIPPGTLKLVPARSVYEVFIVPLEDTEKE